MIYDINPLTGGPPNWSGPSTGKGVTIAVIGQTDIVPADITDFRAAAGLPVNNPTVFTVPGTTPLSVAAGAASNDLSETDLDLEYSGGVAPGASIILVNSGDVGTSLQYAIQNTINGITIPIISQSYGACEAAYPTASDHRDREPPGAGKQPGTDRCPGCPEIQARQTATTVPRRPITSATQGLAVDYPGSSALRYRRGWQRIHG